MLLVITAAGAGSRFSKAGFNKPKPLIKANGKTLLEHTLSSFSLTVNDTLIVTSQAKHGVREALYSSLSSSDYACNVIWVELSSFTSGQLSTALATLDYLKRLGNYHTFEDEPLLIHNCDTGFDWDDSFIPDSQTYATMPVFEVEGSHWSFAKPDPEHLDRACQIAEKSRISSKASIGLYGFRSVSEFHHDGVAAINSGNMVNGEHYIAPILNTALAHGKTVKIPMVTGVRMYGTPDELVKTFSLL